MRNQVLAAVMTVLFFAAFSANADAKNYKRPATAPAEFNRSVPFWAWTYRPSIPDGSWASTVSYGPGNRRCVSHLVQLPNRWWRPVIWCE